MVVLEKIRIDHGVTHDHQDDGDRPHHGGVEKNGAGEFRVFNGSSLATPIFSGIAALIIEKYPDIRDHELREEIFEACLQLENVPTVRQGAGMVQVPTALWFTGV